MGALSSRQLLWAGCALLALGVLILSRGGTTGGLLLCAIGAAMLGSRYFGR
ncbi:MAG TPA: hypothetical protein VMS65_04840 [Polyangiaceae bacterium]|nr:hypothetical protein [Polyangiaceae bacterium]